MNEQPTITANCLAEIEAVVGASIISHEYVTSGAANHIFRMCLSESSIIAKVSKASRPGLFGCEADALRLIANTLTVRTPIVIGQANNVLLLEDLGREHKELSDEQWSAFGLQIGRMHRVHGERFGYTSDNYIGIWRQVNTYSSDWVDFYFTNRVFCYMDSGHCKTILTKADRDALERLAGKIRNILPSQKPSLCHGDFWINNIFRKPDGSVFVIDPAVHFGGPEADLAMTHLYGGFPDAFYDGYRQAHDLARDWKDRVHIYQLKELLLMIAQFQHEQSIKTLRDTLARYV